MVEPQFKHSTTFNLHSHLLRQMKCARGFVEKCVPYFVSLRKNKCKLVVIHKIQITNPKWYYRTNGKTWNDPRYQIVLSDIRIHVCAGKKILWVRVSHFRFLIILFWVKLALRSVEETRLQPVPCCAYRLFNACQLADEFTYLGSAIAVRKCRRFICVHIMSFFTFYFSPILESSGFSWNW